jgi:hypothetical protein
MIGFEKLKTDSHRFSMGLGAVVCSLTITDDLPHFFLSCRCTRLVSSSNVETHCKLRSPTKSAAVEVLIHHYAESCTNVFVLCSIIMGKRTFAAVASIRFSLIAND